MSLTIVKMTEILDNFEMDFFSGSGDLTSGFGDISSGDDVISEYSGDKLSYLTSDDIVIDFNASMSEIIAVDYFDSNSQNDDSENLKWTVKHTIGTVIGALALVIILVINIRLLYKCCSKKRNQKIQSTPRLSKFMSSPKKSFKIRPLPMVVRKTEIWPKCEFYGLDINNFADAVGAVNNRIDQKGMDQNGVYQNGALDKSFDSFSSGNDMFNRAFDNLPAIDQVYIQNEHLI